MTDWLQDFLTLIQYFENPQSYSSEQWAEQLVAFLLHVPNHLAAAALWEASWEHGGGGTEPAGGWYYKSLNPAK